MMLKSRRIAFFIVGLTTVVALMLVVNRGGVIAWSTFVLGVALLAKIWVNPSRSDTALSVGMAIIPALAWVGTVYYVITTYESGEVVELEIDTSNGAHTARVWVLQIGADPVIYYDAPPEVAKSLLAGRPLQFTRGGEVSTRIPEAKQVEALPEDKANVILEAMSTKYGDSMTAADVYYLILGRPRNRVAVVVTLSAL